MASETRVIVGIGEVLWDVLPSGKVLGGAPANFVFHAKEIGGGDVQPLLVSRVGKDPLGEEILARWEELPLSGEFISVDPVHPTGTVSVTVDPVGTPVYAIDRNAAWDYLADSAQLRELAATADAVCFGTLAQRSPASRKTIQAFLRRVEPDALRMLDVNLRAPFLSREVLEESLPLANILKLNDSELRILAEMFSIDGSEEAAAAGLMRRFPLRWIVLTKGDKGGAIYSAQHKYVHRGYPAKMVDSVGAGDAFAAAVVVGMLRRFPVERILDGANRAASFVCSRSGAMPEMPKEIKGLFQ
jgi:fructokinase